jgi:putative ABC transport system permease protein
MSDRHRDLRFALRMFAKSRGFATIAVLTLALGAAQTQILHLVLGHGLPLTSAAVFLGVAGGFALTRFMRNVLFGIRTADPLAFLSGAILLTGVAAVACSLPARRATRFDPIVALRYE